MNNKEEIEKILNTYSINHHHEGIVLQESWFDDVADDIVKLLAIPVVSNRRELLIAYEEYRWGENDNAEIADMISGFLKSNL